MKNYSLTIITSMIMSIIWVSCGKFEVSQIENDNSILATYEHNLPDNVRSIHIVDTSNELYQLAINSESFRKGHFSITNSRENPTTGVYSFENGYAVVIIEGDNDEIFSFIVDSSDNREIGSIKSKKFDVGNSIEIKSVSLTDNAIFGLPIVELGDIDWNALDSGDESWGNCMDDAIDTLYDDWNDDPLGTFSCWMTGPLCAVGGAIACAIK